ncbi:MAG: hypothetical protein ACI8P3_003765 [Saprospiraceae bacterium]|jgi:hypothetical protein
MLILFSLTFAIQSCEQKEKESPKEIEKETIVEIERPEYFLLRPEVEKAYGYTHAVKIGKLLLYDVLSLTQGKAEMKACLALEVREIVKGMILTCQVLLVTEKITIEN